MAVAGGSRREASGGIVVEAEAEAEPRAEGGRGAVVMEWEARRLFVQERPAGGGGSISRCVAGR